MTQMEYSLATKESSIANLLHRHQKLAAFIVTTLFFIALHKVKGVSVFPWDAGTYWKLSAADFLFDFPKDIRGYFYPALLTPARFLSDTFNVLGYFPYRIMSSVIYAYFFTVLLPEFYLHLFGGKATFQRRLITPILVSLLFPGIIIYTLSDLPALALMVSASVCVISSANKATGFKQCALLAFAGLMAYGAYNTRTIYLFPAILLTLAISLVVYNKHSKRIRLLATVIFLCGASIASIPQVIANHKNHDSFSPLVITTSPYNRSLFASQLLWGITMQRYETSIDETSPGPAVFYMDKAGEQLFIDNKIGSGPFEVSTYFTLLLQNPVDFAGIYGRHIVSGLDLRDGEVYTVGHPGKRTSLALFNYLVLFSGLLVMTLAIATQRVKAEQKFKSAFWALLILLPVLAIIPGAIETRFFLALHLAIYCCLAFTTEPESIKALLRRHWLLIIMALVVSATLFFSISTTTMASPQYTYSSLYLGQW